MFWKDESGQMTVEFVVVFPILIIVAVIAVNALLLFSECAVFDRIARDAMRVHAASPTYGQSLDQSVAQIEQTIAGQLDSDYLSTKVSASRTGWGHTAFCAELTFSPTLFGMGLRSSVFGIELPKLHHRVTMTLDCYKPGVLF